MQRNNLKNFIKKKNNNKDDKENINLLSTSSTLEFFQSSSKEDSTTAIKDNSYESPKKIPRGSLSSLENQMMGWSVTDNNSDIDNKIRDNDMDNKAAESRYEFLINIKDKNGYPPGHELYDDSTLLITDSQMSKMTPFEKQFWEIKREYWDTVVFFKKGKFYELYENDADIASKLFNFRITDRVNMRMAGFPESTLDDWICKFLEAGFKVARVDQSENMIGKKIREKGISKDKIIKRELKEIITQGTIYDINHLKTNSSLYTLVIYTNDDDTSTKFNFSILLFDACTLQIFHSSFSDDSFLTNLRNLCIKYNIKEYISKKKYPFLTNYVKANISLSNAKLPFLNEGENECYTYLFNYMKYLNREKSLINCKFFNTIESRLILDSSTIINMDLLSDIHEKTLFNAINYCSTPFGERKLKNWMLSPLSDYKSIKKRQDLSKTLFENSVIDNLKLLGDFERIFSKLRSGNSKFKDLKNFIDKMGIIENIYKNISIEVSVDLENIENCMIDFKNKYKINKEEIISNNNLELFKDKEIIIKKLNEILEREKNNLNCKEIIYKNIGKEIFQLEIPNHVKVPTSYFLISKTKTVNRFYIPEIKDLICEFQEVEERIFQYNGNLYLEAVEYLLRSEDLFFNIINDLSNIDCLISYTIFNSKIKGSVPLEGKVLSFKDLGNPIYPNYITNDFNNINSNDFNNINSNDFNNINSNDNSLDAYNNFNSNDNNILLLTGSNMAGKSTFMRSICLNVILFHMGLNTVSSHFQCPIFDKLFSRMGASDNLLKGESTFMVELLETSNILKNATSNSLVIMDELGRGTSTKDGENIAKAVLNELNNIKCTVFFSTHYHNLITTFNTGFMNTIIRNKEVIFLYKLVKGICEDSNGIYVAKLAGVPEEIIGLAEKYKRELNKKNN